MKEQNKIHNKYCYGDIPLGNMRLLVPLIKTDTPNP